MPLIFLNSLRHLLWRDVEFSSKFFLHLIRLSYFFKFISVCFYSRWHLLIFFCWIIPISLGWSLHDHDRWSYCCVLVIYLLVFYWECFHLCSKWNWSVIYSLFVESLSVLVSEYAYNVQRNCSVIKSTTYSFIVPRFST